MPAITRNFRQQCLRFDYQTLHIGPLSDVDVHEPDGILFLKKSHEAGNNKIAKPRGWLKK